MLIDEDAFNLSTAQSSFLNAEIYSNINEASHNLNDISLAFILILGSTF